MMGGELPTSGLGGGETCHISSVLIPALALTGVLFHVQQEAEIENLMTTGLAAGGGQMSHLKTWAVCIPL